MEKLVEKFREKIKKYLWENDLIKNYEDEAKRIMEQIFDFFMKNPEKLPKETRIKRELFDNSSIEKKALVIADYISGMTDDWLFKNYETYLYSHFSRFKELQIKKSYDWIKISEEGYKIRQSIKIEKPEDLSLSEGTKLKIVSIIFDNKSKEIKEIVEKGKVIYKNENQVEIESLTDITNNGDVLIIEEDYNKY